MHNVYRKLEVEKLENAILRDPHCSKATETRRSCTIATSGRLQHNGNQKATFFIPSVRIIKKENIKNMCKTTSSQLQLGVGRFGTCYLRVFTHYKVCVKEFKKYNTEAFVNEANILAKLNHLNLPYLFGVCVDEVPSLVTSYHGINDTSVTLHKAVSLPSETVQSLLNDSATWMDILKQAASGLKCLHTHYKVIHNDIKSDNICISSSVITSRITAVIVDFGKACYASDGKSYKLTDSQKEQYKANHPHIAPDLRDGVCTQSVQSDVYSFGRMIKLINGVTHLQKEELDLLSNKCMQHHNYLRPEMYTIVESIEQVAIDIDTAF